MRGLLSSQPMIHMLASAAVIGLLSQTPAPPALPAPPIAPENPFTHLLPHLGADLVALPTAQNAGILATGGLFALVFKNNNDARLHTWVLEQKDTSSVASVGNVIGDGFTQAGGAVAVWLAGGASQNVRVETTGANLIRAQVLNGVLTQGLKIVAQRDRPDGGSHSFPSGHTSATFATAAVIQHDYGLAAALPFFALGSFVGYSRVRSNHHWLSDVAFGAALGIVAGRAASHSSPTNWTLVPVKTSGGAALYLVRTATSRTLASPWR